MIFYYVSIVQKPLFPFVSTGDFIANSLHFNSVEALQVLNCIMCAGRGRALTVPLDV